MKWLLFSAFITGLSGNAHCLAMCGGLNVALGLSQMKKRFFLFYQLGRILGYGLLGLIFSSLFILLGFRPQNLSNELLRWIIAFILFGLGIQIIFQKNFLIVLERWGIRIWRPINGFIQSFLPIRQPSEAILLGLLWCVLPCGLIYSVLLLAIASANPIQAFFIMLAFGLGTLPALFLVNVFSGFFIRLFQQKSSQKALGLLIIISAFLSALGI